MNLHTDQATLDHWRTTGTWAMFGEGAAWMPAEMWGQRGPQQLPTRPPAWMTEAAKPCRREWHGFSLWTYADHMDGVRRYLSMQPRTHVEMSSDDWQQFVGTLEREGFEVKEHETVEAHEGICDCDDGRQRHTITVPCEWCAEDGWLMGEPDHYERGTDAWIACHCNPNGDDPHDGRITVPELAVVEWGPLVVEDADDATCTPGNPHFVIYSGGAAEWCNGPSHHFVTLPPDIDPQSLVGQRAIGGKLVTP